MSKNKKFYDPEKALCVLRICNKEGKNIANFYSSFFDDRKSVRSQGYAPTVNGLRHRILTKQYVGINPDFGGAAIYENAKATGKDGLLAKFSRNGELIEKNY